MDDLDRYRVLPGTAAGLAGRDPADRALFGGGKEEGKEALGPLRDELRRLQELLYAEGRHAVLVVLQGIDTAGKDGTIRHVFRGVNPQGVRVAGFKVPTAVELAHDYLWRVHARTPVAGEITIFNRSHYEDVLVVRVHGLVPAEVWSRRYRHIVEFERMLAEEGTTILKFFLHIDRDEQKERFAARLADPEKQWKFRVGDLAERRRWDDYIAAYEQAISETSTDLAPWYVVPANRKWYRNLVVSRVLIATLRGLDMRFPEPEEDLAGIVIE